MLTRKSKCLNVSRGWIRKNVPIADCVRRACYFNALVVGKNNAMAFPDLCRWCGACRIVCPHDALVSGKRQIGTIYQSQIGRSIFDGQHCRQAQAE